MCSQKEAVNSGIGIKETRSARLFHDKHGCIFHRKDGNLPETISSPLKDAHLEALSKLIDQRDVKNLRRLTTLFSKKSLGNVALEIEHKEGDQDDHYMSYIEPYVVPDDIKSAFGASLEIDRGDKPKITIATGTPACCGSELIPKLKRSGIWGALDHDKTLFCTPYNQKIDDIWPESRIFSPGSKMAAYAITEIEDGAKSWGVVEDSLEIAQYFAHYYDIRVFVPLSEKEALRRQKLRNFELPELIKDRRDKGEIVFGLEVPEVIDNYLNYLKG